MIYNYIYYIQFLIFNKNCLEIYYTLLNSINLKANLH